MKNEIVLFTDGDINIEVELSPELETVWLTQKQMGELFEVKQATLSEHINNIISSGELDETSIGFSDKSSGGRKPKIYNLDMILSVGYRVNSKRGIAFRRWANSVLKKYVIQGYAINEKRLQALERTVDIQTKMLASTLEVEESDILKAVTSYTDALMLLDQYDHQSLKKPVGNRPIYKITYEECKKMVSHMEDSFKSDVFGVEKENGKVEGILAAVYQSVFGGDVYLSLEEKVANLLFNEIGKSAFWKIKMRRKIIKMFKGFDFTDFWTEDEVHDWDDYMESTPSDELIAELEEELGYKLPGSYIWLMKQHNGGEPRNTAFPTKKPTSWADDHIAIQGIYGIGREKDCTICGNLGTKFMEEEWGYPDIGVAICDCPSAGHEMIFLDYRECGPQGEPKVSYVDQEMDYQIIVLADNFEDFIKGLISEDDYWDDED